VDLVVDVAEGVSCRSVFGRYLRGGNVNYTAGIARQGLLASHHPFAKGIRDFCGQVARFMYLPHLLD
jgi:hypothetical protein